MLNSCLHQIVVRGGPKSTTRQTVVVRGFSPASAGKPEGLHYFWLSSSSRAPETASGFSRGRKCPAPGMTRLAISLVNTASSAGDAPGAGLTISSAPYNDDGRHLDPRPRGQPLLHGLEPRLARRVEVAVTVGVDHAIDEVGVVEGRARSGRTSRR